MLRRTWKNQLENLRSGSYGAQTLIDTEEPLLCEVLRERAIAHESKDEVDRRRGISGDQVPIRGLGATKCVPGQFSVAWWHGHRLYGLASRRVSQSQVPTTKTQLGYRLGFGVWDLGFGI